MPTDHKRGRLKSRRTDVKPTWARVKTSLETMDRIGLIAIIHDLYEIDGLNRRVLHECFVPNGATLQRYRCLVRTAVFPDPLRDRPIRLREATATIREYQRATGNLTGTVDLMLDYVEGGTAQAADLGYGDDAYFAALERKVNEIVELLKTVSPADRQPRTDRLIRLGRYQGAIGLGHGDFLADVATMLRVAPDVKRNSCDRRLPEVGGTKRATRR